MVNGHQPGAIMQAALNPQLQQLQQSLEAQKQQLLVQQQVLQQQVKPEAQQLNKQQILLAQLLNEPPAKRPQLWEQIKQTQTRSFHDGQSILGSAAGTVRIVADELDAAKQKSTGIAKIPNVDATLEFGQFGIKQQPKSTGILQ